LRGAKPRSNPEVSDCRVPLAAKKGGEGAVREVADLILAAQKQT